MLNQPVLSFKLFCIYISTTSNVCNMVDTSALVLTCVAADTEFGMHACRPVAKKQLHSQHICKAGDTPGSRDSFVITVLAQQIQSPICFFLCSNSRCRCCRSGYITKRPWEKSCAAGGCCRGDNTSEAFGYLAGRKYKSSNRDRLVGRT